MKYARMAETRPAKLTMPPLNGGLNVYDIPSRVADNQLTDCDNLWWHGGTLCTRPGLKLVNSDWDPTIAYTIRQRVSDLEMLLARFDQEKTGTYFQALYLSHQHGRRKLQEQGYRLQTAVDNPSAFGIRAKKNSGSEWYYLLSNGEIIRDTAEGWVEAEPYTPTVLINGVGEEFVPPPDAEPPKASVYEDYNMLTRGFTCHFTTDGTSTTWKLPEGNLATNLPGADLADETGGLLAMVEIDLPSGDTKTAEIKKTSAGTTIGIIKTDCEEMGFATVGGNNPIEIHVSLKPKAGVLQTKAYYILTIDNETKRQQVEGGIPFVTTNNLRITAWRGREHEKNRLAICRMTRGEWYGGDRSGIAGGTRFFVCGNPDEPDLLCWSGIEHPLYFPEHNRVRVGDTHSPLTAMGKQGGILVLFKEREMYALQYSAGTEEDYSFAEGTVAITSYMAQFLLSPLCSGVGCDCPDTVRLVNNRLVWLRSNGSVYMLTATNQYSERNVRMISRNVRSRLYDCGILALKKAQAGEFEGYYLLLVENRMFLMNTQNGAFNSFNYYDDENNAGKAIPWFVWTLPEHLTYTGMVSEENTITLAVTDESRGGKLATLKGETDDGQPIPCRLATKQWDFGLTDHKKSVEHLYLGVRCADMPHLLVTYITEKGRHLDPYRMKNTDIEGVGCCPVRHLTPNVRMVQTFGLQIESRSTIEVDSLTIKIKTQGVVR